MLTIVKTTVPILEAAPNFKALLEEYADECAIEGFPHPSARMEMYKLIEAGGSFHVYAAREDDELVGFITVLLITLLHYGVYAAIVESYFVTKDKRKTGAGTRLRRVAEEYALNRGAPGILLSAPLGGVLAEVLPNEGYTETNRVFFKRFKNA